MLSTAPRGWTSNILFNPTVLWFAAKAWLKSNLIIASTSHWFGLQNILGTHYTLYLYVHYNIVFFLEESKSEDQKQECTKYNL